MSSSPELYVAEGLYLWTLELDNGATMTLLASSLASAIAGTLPSPVVVATRGAAFDEDLDTVPPVLTSLTPPSAKLGDPNFTLHVIGPGSARAPSSSGMAAPNRRPTSRQRS
jgi:hypothetical protein